MNVNIINKLMDFIADSHIAYSMVSFLPEIILIITAAFVLIGDKMLSKKNSSNIVGVATVGAFLALVTVIRSYWLWGNSGAVYHAFSGQLVVDSLSQIFRVIIIASSLLVIMFAPRSRELNGRRMGEYYMLILVATLGMCILSAANTMLMVYLAVEMMSMCSYLLVGYLKYDRKSSEASMKYLIFGAVSSALMLYGISLLYGLTGTTVLSEIGPVIEGLKHEVGQKMVLANNYAFFIATLMVLAGAAYKVALVPFHFWSPDAYEGAPTPVAAFLSVASKAAGLALLIRLIVVLIAPMVGPQLTTAYHLTTPNLWPYLFGFVAILTMTLGNFAALKQTNVKRMLAFSSIAHAGYMLVGVVAALTASGYGVIDPEGVSAIVYYMIVYLFMNTGAFLVAMIVINQEGDCELKNFKGMVSKSPYLVVAMGFFLFSLAGLPPTGGFIGKLFIFKAALSSGWYFLAFAGMFNSVVSLYYYARVMKAMAFEKADDPEKRVYVEPANRVVLIICIVAILVTGLFFSGIYSVAVQSISSLW